MIILGSVKSTEKHLKRFKRCQEFNLPNYTLSEEILNSISHGIGVIFAVVAICMLIISSPKNFKELFSSIVYGSTLFLLYIVSTLYHALKIGKAKKVFRVLDHCSIFLLIAGTYTPICVLKLSGSGMIILAIIWIAAIIGIILNSHDISKYAKLSLACYITMGWAVIFAIKPLVENVTRCQLWLLVSGGITYTIGAVLYGMGKRFRYVHSLWHVFVLSGSILHFMMIYDVLKTLGNTV